MKPEQVALGLARDHLRAFAVFADPNYRVGRVHADIAARLERVERGELRRLMVWAPPRIGKTDLTSWKFPAWYLGRHPDRHVIVASYSGELAAEWGRRTRAIVAGRAFRAAFPRCRLTGGKAADVWSTTAGGGYRAVGTNTTITGTGAHLLIVDDPHKGAAEADSAAHRMRVKRWWTWDAHSRLEGSEAAAVIMQTRWDEDDLSGWLLREAAEPWEVLSVPALDERGRAACPERGFDEAAYAAVRSGISERAWNALYMQRPSPPEGSIFMRDWWRWHDDSTWAAGAVEPTPLPEAFDAVFQSWDPKLKDVATEASSHAVGQVWGRKGGRLWLLDQARAQRGFEWMLEAVGGFLVTWTRCNAVLIEDSAAGPAAAEVLARRFAGRVRIVRVPARGTKRQRAEAAAPTVREGNVMLPTTRRSPWVHGFVEELACFRGDERDDDDQVDAAVQAILHGTAARPAVAVPDVSMVQANPWR